MSNETAYWQNTTHDWALAVDAEHLEFARTDPSLDAHRSVMHLALEVLAYPADEAADRGAGSAVVILHQDGSISISDNGRGTDTRTDAHGQPIKKPVMATKDLRFFEATDAPMLPDGLPRRGMSVVAALSSWLVHSNRRVNGSWTQRYELGLPVTGLLPLHDDGTTGTTVHFLPSAELVTERRILASELELLARGFDPILTLEVRDQRL